MYAYRLLASVQRDRGSWVGGGGDRLTVLSGLVKADDGCVCFFSPCVCVVLLQKRLNCGYGESSILVCVYMGGDGLIEETL